MNDITVISLILKRENLKSFLMKKKYIKLAYSSKFACGYYSADEGFCECGDLFHKIFELNKGIRLTSIHFRKSQTSNQRKRINE